MKTSTLLIALLIFAVAFVIIKKTSVIPNTLNTPKAVNNVQTSTNAGGLGFGRWISSLFGKADNTAYDKAPDQRLPSSYEVLS